MTVIKLTSSGKGFLVIDDSGNVFITSIAFLEQLLEGNNKQGFILLSKLPDKASDSRFKPSPSYGEKVVRNVKEVSASEDSLSVSSKVKKFEEELFTDKQVW